MKPEEVMEILNCSRRTAVEYIDALKIILINEYRNIKKHLRSMRKNIMSCRIGLEEAVEKGDVEYIKHYSEQLRKSIVEYDNLRKRYYEVKGEIVETRL